MRKLYFIIILCIYFNYLSIETKGNWIQPITNYTSESIEELSQTWDIIQGKDGLMYFATSKGITVFDGKYWENIPVANNSVVYSLESNSQDRIFVGAMAEFGYLDYNSQGNFVFKSLTKKLEQEGLEFGNVHEIVVGNDAVYFIADLKLFVFKNDSITVVKAESLFQSAFYSDSKLLVCQKDIGLFELENDELKFVEGSYVFAKSPLVGVVKNNKKTIYVSHLNACYIKRDNEFKNLNYSISKYLKKHKCSVAKTINNELLIGTITGGLVKYNFDTDSYKVYKKNSGLDFDKIEDLYTDAVGNLWIGNYNGVSYLELSSPLYFLNKNISIGAGMAALKNNSTLYLGTSQGMYVNKLEDDNLLNSSLDLEFVEGSTGQVYHVNQIDNQIYFGQHEGLFSIEDNKAKKINSAPGSWEIKALAINPGYYIQGTYSGIQLFHFENGTLKFLKRFSGFNESSRIFEIYNNTVWVTHGYKGVYKIDIDINSDSVLYVKAYDEDDGFPSDLGINVFKLGNDIVFTSEHGGVYKYDVNTDSFKPSEKYSEQLPRSVQLSKLKLDLNGNIWVNELDKTGMLILQPNNLYRYETGQFGLLNKLLIRGFELIEPLNTDYTILGYPHGFTIYDLSSAKNFSIPFKVQIRKIELNSQSDTLIRNSNAKNYIESNYSNIASIGFAKNSAKFTFAAQHYEKADKNLYSFMLVGFDTDWSEWTLKTEKEYSNLHESNYTFKVRAMNWHGSISTVDEFSFEIEKPYYRTFLAYVIYFLLAFLLISVIVKIYYNWKEKENKRKLLQAQQEVAELKNQKLVTELEHKNNELGSLTMHIIHKNETLQKIIDKLNAGTRLLDKESLKNIEKIKEYILSEIENKNDWDYFELHFDKVHNDFLKKIKTQYPELGALDSRLCAYIRMNLSSKEIAAIMNTTLRGVESNRYRLRKKLGLDSGANLKDFLFAIE